MIEVGAAIPANSVTVINQDGQETIAAADYFANKKVVLFAVPGAFTPTCSQAHMPSFVVNADAIKAKGVDEIACLSVNDSFVMTSWQQAQNAEHLTMIADGAASLTTAMGMVLDTSDFGGLRSQRYSMIIDNGIITHLNLDEGAGFETSGADTILTQI